MSVYSFGIAPGRVNLDQLVTKIDTQLIASRFRGHYFKNECRFIWDNGFITTENQPNCHKVCKNYVNGKGLFLKCDVSA